MTLNEGNLWSIVLAGDDGVGPSSLESRVSLMPILGLHGGDVPIGSLSTVHDDLPGCPARKSGGGMAAH